jgi:hypothetical protein
MRVKIQPRERKIGAIIEIMNQNHCLPSPNTVVRELGIARSTAYALLNEVIGRGLAIGVPYESNDL